LEKKDITNSLRRKKGELIGHIIWNRGQMKTVVVEEIFGKNS
jgi:hypothetical protein